MEIRDLHRGHHHLERFFPGGTHGDIVTASVVVNCAGPWVDRMRELAGVNDAGKRVLRTTKGIHCMLPLRHPSVISLAQ